MRLGLPLDEEDLPAPPFPFSSPPDMVPLKPQDGAPADGPDGSLTPSDTIDNIIAGGTVLGLLLYFILGGGNA